MTIILALVAAFVAGGLLALGVTGYLADLKAGVFPWQPGSGFFRATTAGPAGPVGEKPATADAEETLSSRLSTLSRAIDATEEVLAHPNELSERAEFRSAIDLLAGDGVAPEVLVQYALGSNQTQACAALAAMSKRQDCHGDASQIAEHFGRLRPWPMHFALELFQESWPQVRAVSIVAKADYWWLEEPLVPSIFRAYFSRIQELGEVPEFDPPNELAPGIDVLQVQNFLKGLKHPFASALAESMKAEKAEGPDTRFLESVGQVWSRTGETDLLVEPLEWKELLQASENAMAQSPPRSLLVRGEVKAGKTSFLKILGDRLIRKGWTIVEAGGPELQAGQSYIGQLEDRMKRFISELTPANKAIWYVPDILQIAVSGTHHGQTASILDQALPALHAGRLIIITEATPARLTLLNQLRPNMRGLFEIASLSPLTEDRTLAVVSDFSARLGSKAGITIDAAAVPLALQLVRQYMNTSTLPGVVFDLVKLSYNRCMADGHKQIGADDVLATLSQLTGLPRAILNANEKVELDKVHRFFGERVMGQGEAVHAVVDRIAMLKAGLTDPGKPIGVFLFAGPTGTGKTELAKTLAEYLFGSGDRMIRLDMSEFKNHDSISKIVGEAGFGAGQSEALANRVRKQPFSVVLLDEFEKAHPNVWDLFLQVFDDGRLGDANGNVADFRHCIIILTSNLGATVHQNSGLGFGAREEVFSSDQVLGAVAQAFRPEFVNRLDKVIVFQPLKRELMRDILKKELKQVLERRGLRNREWAVEWESSVLDFLLDRGFSAQLGARPLKRAIDQYLLAPLAATIVEHRVPEGDQFLFVRSDGRAIQVEFVDPDAETPGDGNAQDEPRGEKIALAAIILSPLGSARERAAIAQEHRALLSCIDGDAWRALSDTLSLEMADPAFWSRPDRSLVLSRYALMDRVKAASQTAESLRERLDKSRDVAGHFSSELMARLARQVLACRAGSLDALTDAPVEAALGVEAALDGGGDRTAAAAWCNRVIDMYRSWARKRGMQIQEFALDGVTYLAISGFGAYRTLAEEAGLHVCEPEEDDEAGSRCIARVRVVPAPPGDLKPSKAGRVLKTAIEGAPASSVVVRRYRSGSSPLVRDARRGWRSGKTDAVLAGDFDLVGAVAAGDA